MTPDRWQRVEELFTAAQELAPEARAAFLHAACGEDRALLDEVSTLLHEDTAPGLELATGASPLGQLAASFHNPQTLASSTAFGPYLIMRLLGAGAMGEVYLAQDTRLQRKVALKLLAGWLDRSNDIMRRFSQEALSASALNHPNIPVVYETGEIDGRRFIASEFVDGAPLTDRLRQGPLPWREAVAIACKVAEALGAAHATGVIHRDVKPGNILVCKDGRVKLVDFGIAKFSERRTPAPGRQEAATLVGMVLGTPGYMPPEQAMGDPADARSDLWALCAVLHEMLTGARVGTGISQLRKTSGIPGRIKAVLEHGLEPNPERRYQTAADFIRALQGGPVAPSRPVRWSRAMLIGTGAGLLAMVAAAGVAWQRGWWHGPDPGRAVVMLRFDSSGSDPTDTYLINGVQEEIQGRLERISGLTVLSRQASSELPPHPDDLPAIGRRLAVGAALEGSLRRQGNRVEVTANLIATATGRVLWTSTYDRESKDIFEVERDIAEHVDGALRAGWLPGEHEAVAVEDTPNPEAHAALLRADFLRARRDEDSLRKAIAELEEAVRLDPIYAKAYARLSFTWYSLNNFAKGDEFAAAKTRSRTAAEQAIRLAPQLSDGHLAMGWVLLDWDWDLEGARREFELAARLAPSSYAASTALASLTSIEGHAARAELLYKESMRLDPFSSSLRNNLAMLMASQGRNRDAETLYRAALALAPKTAQSHSELALLLLEKGQTADALREARLDPNQDGRDFALTVLQLKTGSAQAAEAALQKFIRDNRAESPFLIARIYAYLGDARQTFEWLDRAYTSRDPETIELLITPPFARFADDPRFKAFRTRLGIPGENS